MIAPRSLFHCAPVGRGRFQGEKSRKRGKKTAWAEVSSVVRLSGAWMDSRYLVCVWAFFSRAAPWSPEVPAGGWRSLVNVVFSFDRHVKPLFLPSDEDDNRH